MYWTIKHKSTGLYLKENVIMYLADHMYRYEFDKFKRKCLTRNMYLVDHTSKASRLYYTFEGARKSIDRYFGPSGRSNFEVVSRFNW